MGSSNSTGSKKGLKPVGKKGSLDRILQENRIIHQGPMPTTKVIEEIWNVIDENGDGDMDRDECRMLMRGIVANTVRHLESRESYIRLAHRCECFRELLSNEQRLNTLVDKVLTTMDVGKTGTVTKKMFTQFFRKLIR
eukprot:EC689544.1.p2 GENE.EC689544.1~~EC689544.1.p2  ORF type:complete len:138 (+),score=49.38 EC689544.1:104-517(+)